MVHPKYSCFLVSIFLSQFEGVGAQTYHFSRAGENATLPCQTGLNYGPECSRVHWIYNSEDDSQSVDKVWQGRVLHGPGSSRVSLGPNCSLIIDNITDQDKGKYTCSLWASDERNTTFILGVLRVSEVPPGPNHNASVLTVMCSISRYYKKCRLGSILWSYHGGNIRANIKQINCVSFLTVKRGDNRTFTCQYLSSKNKVFISTDYTPDQPSTEWTTPAPRKNCDPSEPTGWSWFLVLKALGWSTLISTTLIISICTRDKKETKSCRGCVPGNDYEN
ncbi:uncharacterized protein LOC110162714 isoform X2 [Boleophthalmus pectinirostris]|uniref:uncharacterized protein LOC110162714 isoform X2 n=1 Tax=Boleophthalmus pectinirostris TaxID=150288 RepID=UPI002430E075|nr:uncharacterized protein LOC110162714 isoform X2 [Boleophthalmus pectinirostris]